jgi:dihydroxyacetone kinase-like predicted kinase
MVSVNEMIKEADRRCVQLLNEVDSMKAIIKAELKRRAVFQKKVDSMRTMTPKKVENERHAQAQKDIDAMKIIAVEDRYTAHSEQQEDSVKTMEVEVENPAHSPNQVYSVEAIMKEGYRRHAVLQNNLDCMKMMMTGNVENGRCARKEIDSLKIMARDSTRGEGMLTPS